MPVGYKAGGRKKGVTNKKTQEEIDRAKRILSVLEGTIDTDIAALKPSERASLYIDLMEFVQPKLTRVDNRVVGSLETNIYFRREK